ncbi:alpha/beta hydrolase [Kitasatospora sp. CM 4170]|uniref:Alpha/beta hydrolase n=1 Tax=Kitasatospora aburaviensis TaxID=67265 RepID=A0ABW1ERP6_9ACTN|nr:alpha/beta hydrolase [Kitasatospora sp. CM 4170]WNM44335.1 alpha/beta hydrolase [Kitasatospora sp. CM 4170]
MTTHRTGRRLVLAALVVGNLLLATACNDLATVQPADAGAVGSAGAAAKPAGADDPRLGTFYGQHIGWHACRPDAGSPPADLTGMQCGELRVPLDYADPAADALGVALVRLPAADPTRRVGSLVVNPGGPGGSGVEMVAMGRKLFDGALHNRFDVVGFDPRGSGASSPVTCLTDRQRDDRDQVDLPVDPAKRRAVLEQRDTELTTACAAKSGRLLPFVGTRSTARDLDVLRQALGDPRLNYLGISYGTYLGALYAEEFPARTGRLILDGAVDPAADALEESTDQIIGFESSLRRFADDCVRTHAAECPLGGDPDTAAKKAADYLEGLHDRPLDTADGRRLTSDLGWAGTQALLYGDETDAWPALRAALTMAMVGKRGDLLLASADRFHGRDEKGHYTTLSDSHNAISCADGAAAAPSPERAQQVVAKLKAEAPLVTQGVSVEDYQHGRCENWPFRSPEKPHVVRAEGSTPILVVGSTGDPATPYAAAENLAKGLAHATLLTREGEGHGAFGRGNTCIDAAYEAYLVSGAMPAPGTRCAG